MDDKIDKISDAISDKKEQISEKMSERDYQKRAQQAEENSNGGLGDTAGKTVQRVGEAVDKTGSTIENAGKFGENVSNAAEKTGKATEKAGEVVEKTGQAMQKTGQAMQETGQAMQEAGQATKEAGQAVSTASDTAIDVGVATSEVGVGIPVAIAGVIGKVAGTSAQAVGTGTDVAGKGVEASGKGVEQAGKGVEQAGKGMQKAGKNMQKFGEKGKKSSKKATDLGKKISGRGKDIRNKGLDIREATNGSDGEDFLDDVEDAAKKVGKEVKKDLKDKKKVGKDLLKNKVSLEGIAAGFRIIMRRVLIIAFVLIITIALIYEMALGPLMEGMDKLDKAADTAANFYERMDNFLSGLGFQDSEEAFYDELDYLNTKYNKQLDIPYIMATLFFDDIQSNGESNEFGVETDVEGEGDGSYGEISLGTAYSFLQDKIKEAHSTTGDGGLVYSSNKVYRLRKLAKHSLATGMFGVPIKGEVSNEIPIEDYIEQCKDQLGASVSEFLKKIPALVSKVFVDPSYQLTNLIDDIKSILGGEEVFSTTQLGQFEGLEEAKLLCEIVKQILWSTWYDVKDISLCTNSSFGLCVAYKTYSRDAESYEAYLKQYYIRKMPEFKKYIDTSSEEALDNSIDQVIEEIKQIKAEYEEIFGVPDQSSEFYSKICTGNIKKALLNELVKPVDIDPNQVICFSGSYGFGTSNGIQHQGVDINEETTGNKEGDSVYSIYSNGTVVKSSKDSEGEDGNTASGGGTGFIEIEYNAQLSDGSYKFRVIYEGLNPSSVAYKTNDVVQKGDKIGVIGGVPESGISIPSLHFGIYDINSHTYLDPTNLFIACVDDSGSSGSYNMTNYPNATKVVNAIIAEPKIDEKLKDEVHLAAILANMNYESTGDAQKDFVNKSVEVGQSEYSGGIGIAQWTGSRNTDLRNYAAHLGSTWQDIDVQVKFLAGEHVKSGGADGYAHFGFMNRNKYYGVDYANYDAFLNATDGERATLSYTYSFEGPNKKYMSRNYKRVDLYKLWKAELENSRTDSSSTSTTTVTGNPSCYDTDGADTITSVDNFLFIGDSRYNGLMSDKLKKLGNGINVLAVTSSTPSEWEKNINNGTAVKGNSINYPDSSNVSGISVMLGVNGPSQTQNMKNFLTKLHEKYSNSQIFVNSVYHIGRKYTSGFVNNGQIDSFNATMKQFCNSQTWATYIDVTTGLNDSSGYIKNEYSADGLHLDSIGQEVLVKNIKNKILSSSFGVSNSVRDQLVETAKKSLGHRYCSGGTNLSGCLDCSGFMYAVYKSQGIEIPRFEQHQAQASNMKIVYQTSKNGTFNDSVLSKMHKGDLVFFENRDSGFEHCSCYNEIGHVGMYIGNGQFIHAGDPVKIQSLKEYGYDRVRQVSTWNGNKNYDSSTIKQQCRCTTCPGKCW